MNTLLIGSSPDSADSGVKGVCTPLLSPSDTALAKYVVDTIWSKAIITGFFLKSVSQSYYA